MQIIFDKETPLRKMQPKMLIFPEIVPEAKKKITEVINPVIFDYFGMTVSEFLQLQENILPAKVEKFIKRRKTTFFDYIKILNSFDHGILALEKIVKDTTIQSSFDEESAKVGLIDLTTEEAMLSFLQSHYQLQSLEAAQKLTLYEYITARKVAFNQAKFQKNLINIQKSRK